MIQQKAVIYQKKNIVDPRILIWGFGYLEADFWQYYRIDLIKYGFNEKISWRRFLVFIKALPETSAFNRFLRNKDNRNFAEFEEIASVNN